MCDHCFTHGDGQKWYLNARNYSAEMLRDTDRPRFLDEFSLELENELLKAMPALDHAVHIPVLRTFIRKAANGWFGTWHSGQVVPLQDARAILRLAGESGGIARTSCICRRIFKGLRHEPMCLAFGVNFPWNRPLDEYVKADYTRKVERLTVEEATAFVEECDKAGYIHNIGTLKTPFLIGLCACEYPACAFLLMRRRFGMMGALRKAEYIAVLDPQKCNGCKRCMQRCQFGAIGFSPDTKKALLHMDLCFGCGLCETGCKAGAVRLVPRESLERYRHDW